MRIAVLLLGLVACYPAAPTTAAAPAMPPPISCPPNAVWDGHACVWQYLVTDVRCPQGSAWNGADCAGLHIVCPAGAHWRDGTCFADAPQPLPTADDGADDELHKRPSDVAGVSDDNELFKNLGPTGPSSDPEDPFKRR